MPRRIQNEERAESHHGAAKSGVELNPSEDLEDMEIQKGGVRETGWNEGADGRWNTTSGRRNQGSNEENMEGTGGKDDAGVSERHTSALAHKMVNAREAD